MIRIGALLVLLLGCVTISLCEARADSPPSVAEDLILLKSAKIDTSDEGLLAWVEKRITTPEVRTKIEKLIAKLGADSFDEREDASRGLEGFGEVARAALSAAANDSDAEVRKRARRLLQRIGSASGESSLYAPVARVLADRKPAKALETLLNFLPEIDSPITAEDVARALMNLAKTKEGKANPLLVAALEDKHSVKRYAAAEALIRAGGAANRDLGKKLLKDAHLGVRRRVAVALLETHDKEAIPALIDLLTKAGEDADIAEESLVLVAGDKAPIRPSAAELNREKYAKEWAAWWKDNEAKIDLTKIELDPTKRPYLLVGSYTLGAAKGIRSGTIRALDDAGKERWKISDIPMATQASMASRDRVLICESYGRTITERDLTGKILWSRPVENQARSAERLRNGNTFVVTANKAFEWDRDGNVVNSLNRTGYDIMAATRSRDGSTTILTIHGSIIKFDSSGKEVSSYATGQAVSTTNAFRPLFLSGGGMIIPYYLLNKVVEYDDKGKSVREWSTGPRPNCVVRLSNGNILVSATTPAAASELVEYDKAGKTVRTIGVTERLLFLSGK
jgi:HEAT repeat protein